MKKSKHNKQVKKKRKKWGFLAEKLRYQLRSRKRVTVIITRNATWRIKEESLEENAKASITAREKPSNTNAILSVFHVGPWNPIQQSIINQYLPGSVCVCEREKEREIVQTLTPGARAPRNTACAEDMPSPSDFLFSICVIERSGGWNCRFPKLRERERVVKKKKKREIGCLMDHLVQLSDPIRGPKKIINKKFYWYVSVYSIH